MRSTGSTYPRYGRSDRFVRSADERDHAAVFAWCWSRGRRLISPDAETVTTPYSVWPENARDVARPLVPFVEAHPSPGPRTRPAAAPPAASPPRAAQSTAAAGAVAAARSARLPSRRRRRGGCPARSRRRWPLTVCALTALTALRAVSASTALRAVSALRRGPRSAPVPRLSLVDVGAGQRPGDPAGRGRPGLSRLAGTERGLSRLPGIELDPDRAAVDPPRRVDACRRARRTAPGRRREAPVRAARTPASSSLPSSQRSDIERRSPTWPGQRAAGRTSGAAAG